MFVPYIILLNCSILALFLNGKYVFLFFDTAKNRTDTLTPAKCNYFSYQYNRMIFVPYIILLYCSILALFLNGKYVFLFFGSAKNRTDTLTLYYALCSGSVAAILCINDQFVSLIYEEWYIDGQASFHHSRL